MADDFELGSIAAANMIFGWLRAKGHAGIAVEAINAWNMGMTIEAPEAPKLTRDSARQQGFTGDQCSNCQSMRMQIAGHCAVCAECGTTTGCS